LTDKAVRHVVTVDAKRRRLMVRAIKGPKRDIPNRKERREVLVARRRLARVVPPMKERRRDHVPERAKREPDVGVEEDTPEADEREDGREHAGVYAAKEQREPDDHARGQLAERMVARGREPVELP